MAHTLVDHRLDFFDLTLPGVANPTQDYILSDLYKIFCDEPVNIDCRASSEFLDCQINLRIQVFDLRDLVAPPIDRDPFSVIPM